MFTIDENSVSTGIIYGCTYSAIIILRARLVCQIGLDWIESDWITYSIMLYLVQYWIEL